jgi:hypothetical protein
VARPAFTARYPWWARAQINPYYQVAPGVSLNQYAYNVSVLGRAYSNVPPYMLGYNPYPQVVNYGPSFPTIAPYNPGLYGGYGAGYGLSTVGGYGGGASLATDPYAAGYGLSTAPGSGGYGGYGGYGSFYPPSTGAVDPYAGGYLRGVADVVSATGTYNVNIQQARLLREQARQAAIETRRRRIQEEAEYERMRPTAQTMLDRERAMELERARRDPPNTEVWSGKALNELLRSIRKSDKSLNRAPTVRLDDEHLNLKNINLTDGASRGNVGLLKRKEALTWPQPLKAPEYEAAREDLTKKLQIAVRQLKNEDPVEASTLTDLQKDLESLSNTLGASVGELSPSQYIESRRFLNQLRDAVQALTDPNTAKAFNNTWTAKGSTVAELVDNMKGLQFAPATPGKEKDYSVLYQALRQFEAGLQVASAGGGSPPARD